MKISIVIPTRNRSEFLEYCLQTCLASPDDGIEIVVSDNNSSDATRDVVGSFVDKRLHYHNPGQDLSMRQNFEFALSKATGDYIIFIGDDDGILPNGIATLRYLIETYHPDIVTWRHITYIWPKPDPLPEDGLLKFRYRDFCGPFYNLDPVQILSDFCQAKLTNYRDGANIYHGCVSRKIIEKIKKKGGEYFQGQIPDVNTSITNLTAAKSILWVRNPVTIAGEGWKSNGIALNSSGKTTTEQKEIATNFTSLAQKDKIVAELDLRIRSIPAYTYANLLRVNQDHLDGSCQIDHERWRQRIIEDMRKYPPENRCWSVLEAFFQTADPAYEIRNLSEPKPPITEAVQEEPAVPGRPKKRKKYVDPQYTENVATVVDWLQSVTGKPYYPKKWPLVAFIEQISKSVEMCRNVKLIEKT
ncbi:glycosyltransferase family 2 protein [Sneathiella sp.]|uniref:glycosyltransferase family 2 protein n=1 Tax=Sneathiella sp. TaxID=1964365 RepID=UPI0035668751